MGKIRVLVVDDAAAVRRILTDVVASDPELESAGAAANGRLGLERIAASAPDVVVLDLEMPEMDGIETLAEIRRRWPKLPVIMYSTLTRRGALATLDALAAGASHYVTKPSGVEGREAALQRIHEELIPVVKALHGVRMLRAAEASARPLPAEGTARPSSFTAPRSTPIAAVVIGSSTGGPNALAEVVPNLPADFPAPVLIVQHMPPIFTAMLAERLNNRSALKVVEASDGEAALPGRVYIAPGNYHMNVVKDGDAVAIQLHQKPPENSCRPSADVLFRGAAGVYGAGTLAVVLTGMGQDALRGVEAVRLREGVVFAQDEPTSVVWGMPGYVARAGLADKVLPIGRIAPEIVSRVRSAQRLASAGRVP